MSLEQILREVVGALDAAGISHMLAGSSASSHHGEPRSTQDVDIVIDADVSQVTRLVANLDPERFYTCDPIAALQARSQFTVIDTTTGWKVDLIFVKDRPFSRGEFDRRQPATVLGVQTFLATAEDTTAAKLEWASITDTDRQIRDVAGIVAAQGDRLDAGYLNRWAADLGVADALDRILAGG